MSRYGAYSLPTIYVNGNPKKRKYAKAKMNELIAASCVTLDELVLLLKNTKVRK